MPRKPKTSTPDSVEETPDVPQTPTDAQLQQAGRRLNVEHRRLKIAFADAYVELMGIREENARLSALLQESQRVIREMSAKLPKEEPKKGTAAKS